MGEDWKAEMEELISDVSADKVDALLLAAMAFKRSDRGFGERIMEAVFQDYPQQDDPLFDFDPSIFQRAAVVCSASEKMAWGRLVADAVVRSEPERFAAIQDLMRVRIAS